MYGGSQAKMSLFNSVRNISLAFVVWLFLMLERIIERGLS
jgi:hypothetical protein